MRQEAEAARDLGFSGKGSIHPNQIGVLNDVFSPSVDEIAHAQKIVDAFASAETGLVVVDGKLIEKPVLRSMHRLLSVAERVS
jgi:(S)-citramalyl-CoA lyase